MKQRKRWIALLAMIGAITLLLPIVEAKAAPSISADGAAVIDVDTGRILYEKNGNQRMRVASLTKIMTAIVAIEEGRLEDIVTVPDSAVGIEGSSIYLRHGEQLTLEQMLYGLMLRSGNDAAVAIAHHVGGSLDGFIHLMNEKAEYLGLTDTRFANPHGLDDSEEHYSTPNDMAKLSAYALHNEAFKKIVSTYQINIPLHGEKWDRKLINKNKMLRLYEGADGVKTGYTKLAKRCLVSSATKNKRQVAVVTLDAPDDWKDHTLLLDYAFDHFQTKQIIGKDQLVHTSGLYTANSFAYPLSPGEEQKIKNEIVMPKGYSDMIPGGYAGYLNIYLGEDRIGRIGLVYKGREASINTKATPPVDRFLDLFKSVIWGAWANG